MPTPEQMAAGQQSTIPRELLERMPQQRGAIMGAGHAVTQSESAGVGATLQRDPYRLDFVLMPLVKMLAEQDLSWSQREQVAHAMLASMRHHKSMTDEMQMHCAAAQQQCEGMTIAAGPNRSSNDERK